MNKINISAIQAQIISKFVEKNGSTFVGFSNYIKEVKDSPQPEIANHVVNVNFHYGKAKEKDINTLRSATDSDCKAVANLMNESSALDRTDYTVEEARQFIEGMAYRFENPSKSRSKGQQDAYTPIEGTTLRIHNETGDVYAYALAVHKDVLQKATYPKVNSREKTIVERLIGKHFDLRTAKFRNFKLTADKVSKVAITGNTFTLV